MEAPPGQRFTFVNFSNPGEAKKKDSKKRVRSAAAFSGWDKRFKRQFVDETVEFMRGTAKSDSPPNLPSSSGPKTPLLKDQSELKQATKVKVEASSEYTLHSTPPEHYESFSWIPDKLSISDGQSFEETSPICADCSHGQCRRHCLSRTDSVLSRPTTRTNTSHSTNSGKDVIPSPSSHAFKISPSPDRISAKRLDPFNSYPVPAEPWFDWALHHMLTVFAPRGWPALGITNVQGMDWERFMTRHALQEPALFYVRLLFASGDLVALQLLKPEVSLWLRMQAVQSINQALNNPNRAVSDALILAVGRIALHESMYGDRIAANAIHRPAQFRMITMRGGMQALDFPELVKRLMRWADRVMSMQSGTPRYLVEEDSPNYTLTQSVDVLEKWVPHEGMALRQKVQQTRSKELQTDENDSTKATDQK